MQCDKQDGICSGVRGKPWVGFAHGAARVGEDDDGRRGEMAWAQAVDGVRWHGRRL